MSTRPPEQPYQPDAVTLTIIVTWAALLAIAIAYAAA